MKWEHWQRLDCKAVGKKKQVIWPSEGALTAVSSGCPGHDLVMDHAVPLCFPTSLPQQNRLCRPCLLEKAQLEKNLHYNPGCCGHSLKKKKIKPPKAFVTTPSKLSAHHFSTHVCCGLQEIFWVFKRPAIKDLCLVWVWFLYLSFSSLVTSSRNLAC